MGCLFYVLGITVTIKPNSKKKIRVFPLVPADQQQPRLRTNTTYDAFMNVHPNQQLMKSNQLRDRLRGHVSPCVLRKLKYFDVGTSFLSDSLHNVYHGVMVSDIYVFLASNQRELRTFPYKYIMFLYCTQCFISVNITRGAQTI